MKRLVGLICVVIALAAVLWSCGEDKAVVNNEPDPVEYFSAGELFHLDTTVFLQFVTWESYSSPRSEWRITGEAVLGEPYTDINRNGVYDPGVDMFFIMAIPACGPSIPFDTFYVRCVVLADVGCDSVELVGADDLYDYVVPYKNCNNDLNRTGKYEGPNVNWALGIPFDDLNGNGVYDIRDDGRRGYQDGFPFVDFNENGSYDSLLEFRFIPYKYTASGSLEYPFTFNLLKLRYHYYPELFHFRSDSGADYYLSAEHQVPGSPDLKFRLDSLGISFNNELTWPQGWMLILDAEEVKSGNVVLPLDRDHVFYRSVSYGQSVVVCGLELNDVVRITVDSVIDTTRNITRTIGPIEFYFNRDEGLLGVEAEWGDPVHQLKMVLDKTFDTLPLPMTRIEPQ